VPEKLLRAIRGEAPAASPLKASLAKSRKEKMPIGENAGKMIRRREDDSHD
jgi:hypothetical protein